MGIDAPGALPDVPHVEEEDVEQIDEGLDAQGAQVVGVARDAAHDGACKETAERGAVLGGVVQGMAQEVGIDHARGFAGEVAQRVGEEGREETADGAGGVVDATAHKMGDVVAEVEKELPKGCRQAAVVHEVLLQRTAMKKAFLGKGETLLQGCPMGIKDPGSNNSVLIASFSVDICVFFIFVAVHDLFSKQNYTAKIRFFYEKYATNN